MCEIFPEVESCCGLASIRVGMVIIAVLSITTGALTLSVVERHANFSYVTVFKMYKKAANITDPKEVKKIKTTLANLISMSVAFVSFLYIIAGIALLFSTLSDQEGFAQMFVWLVFMNIFIGFLVVFAISFQCIYGTSGTCMFGNKDWLSSSIAVFGMVAYLLMWYYFCSVANSYVLNGHT